MKKFFFSSVAFCAALLISSTAFSEGAFFEGALHVGGVLPTGDSGATQKSCGDAAMHEVFGDARRINEVGEKKVPMTAKEIWKGTVYADDLGNSYMPVVFLVSLKNKNSLTVLSLGECTHQVNTAKDAFWTYFEYQATVIHPAFYPIGNLQRNYINDLNPARQKAWRELNKNFAEFAVGAENLNDDK